MSNVVLFPNNNYARTDDDAVTALRKAIHRCRRERGEKTAALVIAQSFDMPDFSGWRDRARKMIKGDK